MSSKPITIAGLTFLSLRKAAAHFGEHYGNAVRRINAGWTPEEALGLKEHRKEIPSRGITLATADGTFDSIRDAAEHFGIKEGTIQRRLSSGWTPDQAVGLESHTKKPKATKEVTFGPLCVHPAWQRRGVGSALIGHSRALATRKGYPAILILGDPHNYCKHGFKTGKGLGVSMLDGRYSLGLLVLELRQGFFASSQHWKFQTSAVYEFDAVQVEAYDARFPPKEKKHQYSQDLFAMLVRAVVE